VTVRLEFRLSEPKRLFLIVRGPAPSCDVAGVIPVRGRSGANKVVFAGRAGGRALPAGTYALSLSPVRRPAPGAPATYVEVVSKRRSVPARADALRPDCVDPQALAAYSAAGLLRREDTGAGRGALPGSRGDILASVPPGASDDQHDVLGAAIPGSGPDSGGVSDGLIESLLSIGVLTLVGAMLLATVALVTRFVRGSWNP
jgi:hypothetical protein